MTLRSAAFAAVVALAVAKSQGRVQNPRTGKVTTLGFGGWVVMSATGQRLLLTHRTAQAPSTRPQDWCVLPTPSAAQSQVRRCPPRRLRAPGW